MPIGKGLIRFFLGQRHMDGFKGGHCVTCGAPLTGHYCAQCGERVLHREDFTLAHFFEDAIESLTHADGKIFLTLKDLITAPGLLTVEFIRGRRKPYLAPLSLFLTINLFFFFIYPLTHVDALTTKLVNHLYYQPYGPWIQGLVSRRLLQSHEAMEQFEIRFDDVERAEGKALVILMVPLFAMVVALLQYRLRRPAVRHLVFAAHFMSAWLLMICPYLVIFVVTAQALAKGFEDQAFANNFGTYADSILALLQALYLYFAFRTAYGQTRWAAAWEACIASVAFLFVVLKIYRLALFFTTLVLV